MIWSSCSVKGGLSGSDSAAASSSSSVLASSRASSSSVKPRGLFGSRVCLTMAISLHLLGVGRTRRDHSNPVLSHRVDKREQSPPDLSDNFSPSLSVGLSRDIDVHAIDIKKDVDRGSKRHILLVLIRSGLRRFPLEFHSDRRLNIRDFRIFRNPRAPHPSAPEQPLWPRR